MRFALYRVLRFYCKVCLRLYFRTLQVSGRERVPNGPVLFVANHQNAFLDAILVACSSHREPWFITRASVFQKPWAAYMLALLRMIPVYRFRDGFGTLRRNEQTMTRTAALLRSGEAVLIFAEGNHDSRRRLRPLQKGFVRLAMDCLSQLPAQEKLHVVPVGIQYDSLDQFRTRVLVQFGEPVLVEAEMDQAALIEVTAQRIREMILHVEPLDSYDQQMQWLHANRRIQGDLIAQLQADRHVLAAYKGQSVPIAVSHSRPHLNPLWWWGFVNHLLPYYCLRWILRRKMKDAQFAGSLKFSVGIFLLPACYALQTSVLALLGASPTWQLLYVCHLPVVGLAAHAWSVPRSLR